LIKTYLNELKTKTRITCAEWSKLSNVPEATIRKILSGETADPRLETIVRMVASVGGSMDDIVGSKKETEIETNAVITLKESHEARIADLKEHMQTLRKDKKVLSIVTGVLVLVFIGLFIIDIATGSSGWVRY
jgi:predicted transcriptional regulator